MKNEDNEIEQVSSELVLPPDASLALVAERLVDQAKHDGVALTGEGGLLTGLMQQVLQSALEFPKELAKSCTWCRSRNGRTVRTRPAVSTAGKTSSTS